MATLTIAIGPTAGQHFDLSRHRLVMIGRDEACTFQILDDRVSRKHLQLRYRPEDDRHYVIDPGSANGVRVNGTRVTPGAEHAVQDGDQIRIGRSLIIYTDGDHPEAEKAMRGLRLIGE